MKNRGKRYTRVTILGDHQKGYENMNVEHFSFQKQVVDLSHRHASAKNSNSIY